jgi:hypothetical protein
VAVDEHINNKCKLENNPPNFRDRKDMKRVLRIASTFAASLGGSSIKVGNSYLLSEISREDARRWIEEQLQAGRTLPTVGRDSAALSAIYKTAQWEYQQKDPELGSRGNPFSGLRDELKKRDDLAVRKGQRVKSSARAWSPEELNQRYIDSFSKDPTLKPHGFRNTLQAKFDAADTPNKTSGYLIGWKNQDTVGMQKEYNKQGYPHLQLLQVLKACHAVEEWAS